MGDVAYCLLVLGLAIFELYFLVGLAHGRLYKMMPESRKVSAVCAVFSLLSLGLYVTCQLG